MGGLDEYVSRAARCERGSRWSDMLQTPTHTTFSRSSREYLHPLSPQHSNRNPAPPGWAWPGNENPCLKEMMLILTHPHGIQVGTYEVVDKAGTTEKMPVEIQAPSPSSNP